MKATRLRPVRSRSGPASAKCRIRAPGDAQPKWFAQGSARLQTLYEINKLLAQCDSVEDAVARVATLVKGALAFESLIISHNALGEARTVTWHAEEASPGSVDHARLMAHNDLRYEISAAAEAACPSAPAIKAEEPACTVLLPLALDARPMFGVVQLGAAQPFDEADLSFMSALVNNFAVALDRHALLRATEAKLRAAEQQIAASEIRAANAAAACWSAEWLHRRLESLVDNVEGAFVWEANANDLTLVYVSQRVEALLGYAREEFVQGAFYLNTIYVEDRDDVECKLRAAASQKEDRRFLHRSVDSDGRVRWFQTGVHVEGDGDARRLCGITFDVSELQLEREQMQTELELGHGLTNRIGDGVIAVGRDSNITFMNEAAGTLLSLAPSETHGKPWEAVLELRDLAGKTLPPPECPFARALRTGETVHGEETFFVRRDRTPFLAEYVCAPIAGRFGVEGSVLTFRSITEVKRLEMVNRFLAQLSAVLGSSLDYRGTLASIARLSVPFFADVCIIHRAGMDGDLTNVEVACADPTNAELAESIHRLTARPDILELLQATISSGEPMLVSNLAASKSQDPEGAIDARSLLMVPLETAGERLGVLTFLTCESGRKYTADDVPLAESIAYRAAMAVQNAKLYSRVQDAVRARQDVLAIVSHDLRTPLNNITMSIDMLLKPSPEESPLLAGKRLGIIQRSAQRMDRMLRDLLDVSSIEAGRLSLKLGGVAVSAIADDVRDSVAEHAYRRTVRLDSILPIRDFDVFCDRERILQVLVNLIDNAIKFSKPGGVVTLRVRAVGGCARFEVSDEGPGITPDKAAKVFDRYWQASETATQGRGLGLYIAKGIIASHGGEIWCDSDSPKGATFGFTVALASTPRPLETREPSHSGHDRLVLVVDDDPTMRGALQALLESKGFRVELAEDGAEALQRLSVGPLPDLILLDLFMPRMDGWSFLAHRARNAAFRSIPVIVASSDQSAAKRVASAEVAFVTKPIQPDELLDQISTCLH